MKGTIFKNDIEYNLLVEGESWVQGGVVRGSLKLKNHSENACDLSLTCVELALGKFRKIKTKSKTAFESERKISFEKGLELDSKGDKELKWEFELPVNCPITDKVGTYYLIYGGNEDKLENGLLELNITPNEVFLQFFDILEKFFRFKVKEYKSKNEAIEAKLAPPKSKNYSNLIGVNISVRILDKNLEVDYLFNVNSLDFSGGGITNFIKKKVEVKDTLHPKDYLIYGDSPNQDGMRASIQKVLDQVKPNSII